MGFPVGYSELPKLVLHFLLLLGHIRRVATWALRLLGLDGDLAVAEAPHYHDGACVADRLDEHLPAVRFADLATGEPLPESCAVCLGDFDGGASVRRPAGCRHVFHRGCLDRWAAAHAQRTCPLCRAPLLPPEAGSGDLGGTHHVDESFYYNYQYSSNSPAAAALLLPFQFPSS